MHKEGYMLRMPEIPLTVSQIDGTIRSFCFSNLQYFMAAGLGIANEVVPGWLLDILTKQGRP